MRVAFITPVTLLHLTEDNDYHLVLPAPMTLYTRYYTFYKRTYGYKILDNGEAEGLRAGPRTLLDFAATINANEIVMPDTIGDSRRTIRQARKWEKHAVDDFRYMGVVQGESPEEVQECMKFMYECDYVHSIGLPKHLTEVLGDNARYTLAKKLWQVSDKPIHCLGCAPNGIIEVAKLAECSNVRGIDTSLPTFCALWGFDIRRDNVQGAYRPNDYWDMDVFDKEEIALVKRNHQTFLDWAKAT